MQFIFSCTNYQISYQIFLEDFPIDFDCKMLRMMDIFHLHFIFCIIEFLLDRNWQLLPICWFSCSCSCIGELGGWVTWELFQKPSETLCSPKKGSRPGKQPCFSSVQQLLQAAAALCGTWNCNAKNAFAKANCCLFFSGCLKTTNHTDGMVVS